MKKIIAGIIGITLCAANSYAQGIKFSDSLSWSQLKEQAKKEHKYIMMDTYTTWCGPCRMMSASTFPDKGVGEAVNPYYLAVKVQMDQTKNDSGNTKRWYADAKAIGAAYKISAYPTILFFSPEGRLVSRMIGYRDPAGFIAEVKAALDPKTQYYTLLDKYNKQALDTAGMHTLAIKAGDILDKETASKASAAYISHISPQDIYQKNSLLFISKFTTGSTDHTFSLFQNEPAKIDSAVAQENFAENLVMEIIAKEEIDPYTATTNPNWDSIATNIRTKYKELGMERLWGSEMLYYLDKSDWANFGKCYKLYFDSAIPHHRRFVYIDKITEPLAEHISDKAVLNTAAKAMAFTIANYDPQNSGAFDTYANILYKLGRKEEAISWETKACNGNPDNKVMATHLAAMKAGTAVYE